VVGGHLRHHSGLVVCHGVALENIDPMNLTPFKAAIARIRRNRLVARVLEINGRFGADGGGYLAAALAYYAFFSLFPLLLLGASVAGFVLAGDPAGQARLAGKLAGSIPGLGSLLGDNVRAVVDARGATGIVGLVGALWSGTGLARAASYALATVNRTKEPGNYLKTQAWALSSTVGLGLLAVATTLLGAGIRAVPVHGAAHLGLMISAIVVSLVLDLTLFVTAYKVLHRGPSTPMKRIWRGALLPAAGWTALKFAGSWYAARTVKGSTAVFGAFASVVGILVILYLISRLFVFGAEINAVFDEDRTPLSTQMRKAKTAA
jgi:inner membrane protein YhjD